MNDLKTAVPMAPYFQQASEPNPVRLARELRELDAGRNFDTPLSLAADELEQLHQGNVVLRDALETMLGVKTKEELTGMRDALIAVGLAHNPNDVDILAGIKGCDALLATLPKEGATS